MAKIHPLSLVSEKADLGADVEVGPFTIIGPDVKIGEGSRIGSHVVIRGHTCLGKNNSVGQFTTLGDAPPDLKYRGTPTRLEFGDNNTIRENVVIHRGTEVGGGVTRIGNNNLLMAYCHVGHDCTVKDHVIIASYSALAGHVIMDDYARLGGRTSIAQYCYIGKFVFTAGVATVTGSVPAFTLVRGNPGHASGINAIGLRRHGYDQAAINTIRKAFHTVFNRGLLQKEIITELSEQAREKPVLKELVESIKSCSTSAGMIRCITRNQQA